MVKGGSPRKPPRARVFQSTGLTPAAATRTSTSVGVGAGLGTSTRSSPPGPPSVSWRTARMVVSLLIPRLLPAVNNVVYRPALPGREEQPIGAVYTRGLEELRGADADAFGGKSANLGELL